MIKRATKHSRLAYAANSLVLFLLPLGEGKRQGTRTALFLLMTLALLWTQPLANAQEPRRILYGVSTSISHLPVWVGKDTGLFAKNGLNIEPVQIRGGAVSTMAIMSGQSVLSGVGAGSVVAARVEGGDIVLLACPADLEPVYLIARPEIKSPAELKG